MTKNAAINLAIDALWRRIHEKIWDAEHPINDYGKSCKLHCDKWQEAINILEALKDERVRSA